MRNGRVIVFTSSGGDFTGNDVTDDVIITKSNRVHPYLPRSSPVKFHQDRTRFSRVRVYTSSEGNLPEMTSLMTSLQKFLEGSYSYPPRNNPVKFHRDQIRFSWVTVFTSAEAYFTGNDVTDDVIVTKFVRGVTLTPQGTVMWSFIEIG